MSRNYEEIPTFLGYSEDNVGVIAGGGIFGYGGIVLHEPTETEFSRVITSLEHETVSGDPIGAVFSYNSIATITVSGLLRWTNFNLKRAPSGRQDLRETGQVRIEIFDEDESRQYVEQQYGLFERLGVQFIGS